MTVGIYARLSPKPNGKYEGVQDQIKWGREYAAKTWPGEPLEVFTDEGISGAKGDRAGYDRLVESVAAGTLDHLWTVEQSRLMRGEMAWFQLNATLEASGVAEVHTSRNGIIRVGDVTGGILAVVYANERRQMMRRLTDTLAEKAGRGEPPGVRPFGYVHSRLEDGTRTYALVAEQAEAIRHAAEKVLDGWSLANVATELGERGVRGVHGGKVTGGSVRGWLTAPSIAGLRVHSGRIIGDGNWEPILDRQTFEQVKTKLTGTRTVKRTDGGTYPVGERHRGNATGRRYVLTGGLAVCGVCDAPLVGTVKQLKNGKQKPYLLCHPSKGGKGCIGVMLPETDAYVIECMFAELARPDRLNGLVSEDEHQQRRDELVAALADLERQREELAGLMVTDGLTTAEWRGMRNSLIEKEHLLREQLSAVPAPATGITAAEAQESWDDMTLDERREFVRAVVAKVTIRRAKPGTMGFDPGRVVIEMRDR